MFRVVPDQLRISEGWVRCGQCGEIFNASQHLLAPPGQAAEALVAPINPSSLRPPPESIAFTQLDPASFMGSAVADATASAAPATATATALVTPVPPAHAQTGNPAGPSISDAWLQETSTAPEPDVSFMRSAASTDSFWKRRTVRIVLLLLVIALACALAAQILFQERNRIVQLEPATRPVLAALCALAGCELGALKQIESIVIDSSSFGRLRADNYRLGFSLRNTAAVDVAMPAMELSLTDTQDQALIRRVIRPDE